MLKLSAQDKAFIINKHQQGWKTCVIKQQLSKRRNVHVSYTTVYHVQKSFDAGLCDIHGTNVKPKRKRVPPVVTPIVIKLVKELLSKKPEQSAPVICQILRDNYNLRLSLSSTKLAINQAGFKGRMVMRVDSTKLRKYASTKVHDKELNSAAVTSESAVASAESVSTSLSSSTEAGVLAVSSSAEASVTSIHSPSESEVITIPSPVELIDEIASTAMDVPTEPVPPIDMPTKNVSTAICDPSEPVSTSIVANAKLPAAVQPVCTSASTSSMGTSSHAPAETVSKSISEIAEYISTSKSVPTLIAVSVQSGMTSSPTETVSTPADSPLSHKTKMLEAHQQFTRARHGLKLGTSRRFFRRRQPFQAMSMKIDRMEDTCARIEEKLDMLIKQCGLVGVQPADVKPLMCDDMKPVSPIVVTPFSSSSMPPLPPAHFPPAGMTSFTPSNDMSSWPPSTMAPLPSDEMTACSGADMTSWSPDTPLWGHSSVTPAPYNPTDNQSLEISAETLAHMSSHSYTNTPTQFAMRLMIHYFPDLFGADNRRFHYNVSGCRGKERLDPMRVNAIRRYVSMYFPEVADDRVWITKCVSSMNERLRRPSSRVSAGFPGSI